MREKNIPTEKIDMREKNIGMREKNIPTEKIGVWSFLLFLWSRWSIEENLGALLKNRPKPRKTFISSLTGNQCSVHH